MTSEQLTQRLSFLATLSETRFVRVIRGGLSLAGTLMLPAAALLLLAHFPLPGWEAFWAGIFGTGWQAPLDKGAQAVYRFIALSAAFGTAYHYAKDAGEDEAVSAGILGATAFLTLVPWSAGGSYPTAVLVASLPMQSLGVDGFGLACTGRASSARSPTRC